MDTPLLRLLFSIYTTSLPLFSSPIPEAQSFLPQQKSLSLSLSKVADSAIHHCKEKAADEPHYLITASLTKKIPSHSVREGRRALHNLSFTSPWCWWWWSFLSLGDTIQYVAFLESWLWLWSFVLLHSLLPCLLFCSNQLPALLYLDFEVGQKKNLECEEQIEHRVNSFMEATEI